MNTARKMATFADMQALPEDTFAEIASGELLVLPRPRTRHAYASGGIMHAIGGPFMYDPDGPGGWWILPEPAIEFAPGEIACPDAAGWRTERVHDLPDEPPIPVVPDWTCEILSPSTALRDRTAKIDLYLRCGVGHYWIIDPVLRTVEVFEARNSAWVLLGTWTADDAAARVPPFDAIPLKVGLLFRR